MSKGWGRPPWARSDPWSDAWAEWWRGPPPRADRGLVRYLVLDAIAAQPRHGYEIIQVIGERSGGGYRPSPGVIYPTLQMLEELGHARAVARDDRKVYAITEEGQRDLAEHAEEVAEFYQGYPDVPWERYAEDVATLGKRLRRIIHLFKHAVHRGGIRPSTMRKVRAVLDEALEKLEELLSREVP